MHLSGILLCEVQHRVAEIVLPIHPDVVAQARKVFCEPGQILYDIDSFIGRSQVEERVLLRVPAAQVSAEGAERCYGWDVATASGVGHGGEAHVIRLIHVGALVEPLGDLCDQSVFGGQVQAREKDVVEIPLRELSSFQEDGKLRELLAELALCVVVLEGSDSIVRQVVETDGLWKLRGDPESDKQTEVRAPGDLLTLLLLPEQWKRVDAE
mmetsp:Transcript_134410/g.318631  ORF Transcript_134410/g.318631 Transcript_134410/m.318631 type:complete len:211 (-) Transcript_134410:776-1408(-)